MNKKLKHGERIHQMSIGLPVSLVQEVRAFAIKYDTTLTHVVMVAVQRFIKSQENA